MAAIANNIEHVELPENPIDAICAVTGLPGQCISKKHLLKSTFANWDLIKAPQSEYVSVAAYQAMKYPYTRKSSWIVTPDSFKRLHKKDVIPLVLGGVKEPVWAGYVTTSYKKHGSLMTPVNSGARAVWRFEMLNVDCGDIVKINDWYERLYKYYIAGIWRANFKKGTPGLETGDTMPFIIQKVGVELYCDFKKWAADKHDSSLYRFLCYLLPSKEDLKKENSDFL